MEQQLAALRGESLDGPPPQTRWRAEPTQAALRTLIQDLFGTYRRLLEIGRAIPEAASMEPGGRVRVPLRWEIKTGIRFVLDEYLASLIDELITLACITQEELDRD